MVTFNVNRKAQGTIEYLVIIAIVVVISLVVVSILTGFLSNGSEIDEKSSQISDMSNLLAINDTIAGEDGNGLIVLKNNDSETITIDKIAVDDVDHNFSETLPFGSQKSFKVEDITSCDGTKKSYTIKIYYTSKNGLAKTADFQTMTINCTPVVTPAGSFVEETSSEEVVLDDCDGTATDPDCWSSNINIEDIVWSTNDYYENPILTNANSETDGQYNTDIIIDNFSTGSDYPAFEACANLDEGGFPVGTWYLPAIQELDDADGVVSGFLEEMYWSSTEYSEEQAYAYDMQFNGSITEYKDTIYFSNNIRCLRDAVN
jgi:hypothetical protein